jgi:YVTN family beta-propeller protein
VTPIDTTTNAAGAAIPVCCSPVAVAITPDGKTAYVITEASQDPNLFTGTVTPIEITNNNKVDTPIPIGIAPTGIAITPDGTTAYVTNRLSDSVTPIDTATKTAGTPITLGSEPFYVAITPDGKTAYVTNQITGR